MISQSWTCRVPLPRHAGTGRILAGTQLSTRLIRVSRTPVHQCSLAQLMHHHPLQTASFIGQSWEYCRIKRRFATCQRLQIKRISKNFISLITVLFVEKSTKIAAISMPCEEQLRLAASNQTTRQHRVNRWLKKHLRYPQCYDIHPSHHHDSIEDMNI